VAFSAGGDGGGRSPELPALHGQRLPERLKAAPAPGGGGDLVGISGVGFQRCR